MKERPILFSGPMVRAIRANQKWQTRRIVRGDWTYTHPACPAGMCGVYRNDDGTFTGQYLDCPYGQPGDRLWVRETWAQHTIEGDTYTVYRADSEPDGDGAPWRPSIFMPRVACRIVLEITGVRVERLQDISEADVQAEGVDAYAKAYCSRLPEDELTAVEYYEGLWDSLNKARGYGWDSNPWVWVLTFEQVK